MTNLGEIELSADDIISVSNAQTSNDTTLVEDTDWSWKDRSKGEIYLYDSKVFHEIALANESNFTEWDFTHGSLYIQSATARTIIANLVLIFFVVGLVIWVYVMVKNTWLDQIV